MSSHIHIRRLALVLGLVSAAASSCVKANLNTIYDSQETRIESFINTLKSSADTVRVERRNVSNRAVVTEGSGEMLDSGGNVAFYYAGYVFTGSISPSNLFATNHAETAESARFPLKEEDAVPVTVNLKDADICEGLRNGLYGVCGGEECYIVFSGKYGFGRKQFGTIPANSAIAYHIWVESISNE